MTDNKRNASPKSEKAEKVALFKAGMNRLLALKVESRLTTEMLMASYCQELANIDGEAWKYAVDCAMKTETVLPAPAWFLQKVKEYADLQNKSSNEFDRAAAHAKLNEEFSSEQSRINIRRLAQMIRKAGNLNVK